MRTGIAAVIVLTCAAGLVTAATAASFAAQAGPPAAPGPAALTRAALGPAAARDAAAAALAAAPARVAAPALAGTVHVRIISVSVSTRRQSALATGAFTAGGYRLPGRVAALRATDKMVFPNGSFRVHRHITHQRLPVPTRACRVAETVRGWLTVDSGTGAYRGISGHGGFSLQISGVIRKAHGKCGGRMTVYQAITYETAKIRS